MWFFIDGARAYHGGASSREFQDLMPESKSLDLFIRQRGSDMSKRSTISELMNAVSNQTRDEIINQQDEWIEKKELEEFDEIYQDSTPVEADTEFPNDATIIRKLLDRIWTNGTRLDEFGLENFRRVIQSIG